MLSNFPGVSEPRFWFKIALFNFLAAAILGVLLRFAFIQELSWMNYTNVLHAHSHVASLGWLYLALFAILTRNFVKKRTRSMTWIFWISQISVIGMFCTFIYSGYAPLSIGFSTLHAILSYEFAHILWKELREREQEGYPKWALIFIKSSLAFMILSTLALWALPALIIGNLKGSAIYYAIIQFYLHFQFNGWFIFAVIGLFLYGIGDYLVAISDRLMKALWITLSVSCLLTYALSVTWSMPIHFLFTVNGIGALIQLISLILFLIILRELRIDWSSRFTRTTRVLMWTALICLVLKTLIQTSILIPGVADMAFTIRNFVLAFIHLILLGIVTSFLLAEVSAYAWFKSNAPIVNIGIGLYFLGFVLTELLLSGQGLMLWLNQGFLDHYHTYIFIASLILPIALVCIIIGLKNAQKRHS